MAVFHSVLPIRTSAGIIPQPYVTNPKMAFRSRLCFAGTVTKKNGAGPRQYQILPLNSMIIVTVYQMPNGVGYISSRHGGGRGLCLRAEKTRSHTFAKCLKSCT